MNRLAVFAHVADGFDMVLIPEPHDQFGIIVRLIGRKYPYLAAYRKARYPRALPVPHTSPVGRPGTVHHDYPGSVYVGPPYTVQEAVYRMGELKGIHL